MSGRLKVCYDRILPRDLRRFTANAFAAADLHAARMAVLRAKKWANGSTLRIKFLGGTAAQQNIVRQFAPEWCQYANLHFEFSDAPDAEVRITFDEDLGAWSYIGKDCLDIPRDQPTMNLGWQDEGVVLHEFGHAIGLIHEHQNPLGGIHWNRANVIRDLSGPPNNWDLATIEHNMFDTYSRDLINGTELDPKSIMLYAIPSSWTTDGFHSDPNEVLSATDKSYIGNTVNYPSNGNAAITQLTVSEKRAVQATIAQAGQHDLFQFEAAAPGRYVVETEGSTDLVMSLFGPNSQTALITQDDDGGSGQNPRIEATLAPGTYYADVRHYDTAAGTGAFSISVTHS